MTGAGFKLRSAGFQNMSLTSVLWAMFKTVKTLFLLSSHFGLGNVIPRATVRKANEVCPPCLGSSKYAIAVTGMGKKVMDSDQRKCSQILEKKWYLSRVRRIKEFPSCTRVKGHWFQWEWTAVCKGTKDETVVGLTRIYRERFFLLNIITWGLSLPLLTQTSETSCKIGLSQLLRLSVDDHSPGAVSHTI